MDISILTIAEIRTLVLQQWEKQYFDETLLKSLAQDGRIGVQKIYNSIISKQQKNVAENMRLISLLQYEQSLKKQGKAYIAGVDEAGRGPLAGPVIAGAVILPPTIQLYGLNDSKKISKAKRAELSVDIKKCAIAWAIGEATVEEIAKLNIFHASLLAMKRAVEGLNINPDHLLVDAVKIPYITISQTPIVKGDSISASIAAASIIAKTHRDKIMEAYHQQYPQYGFDKHKGYGTAEHIRALNQFGVLPIHRRGYAPVDKLCQK